MFLDMRHAFPGHAAGISEQFRLHSKYHSSATALLEGIVLVPRQQPSEMYKPETQSGSEGRVEMETIYLLQKHWLDFGSIIGWTVNSYHLDTEPKSGSQKMVQSQLYQK